MKKIYLFIILFSLLIFTGCAWRFWDKSVPQNVGKNQDIVIVDDTKLDDMTSEPAGGKASKNSANWPVYEYQGFKFGYPIEWKAESLNFESNDKARFLNSKEEMIALFTCPLVVVGYPRAKVVEDRSKEYGNGGYVRLMVIDNSLSAPNEIIGLIIIKNGSNTTDLSCQLFSSSTIWRASEMQSIYGAIFDSIK